MSNQERKYSNRKREILKQYESSSVTFFASLGIGTFVCIVLSLPIRLFIDYDADLIHFITGMCGTVITLFYRSYNDGYNQKNIKIKLIFLTQLMVLATQVLLVLIFGHTSLFCGSTVFLSNFILNNVNPESINGEVMSVIYKWVFMFLAFMFIYTPITIVALYRGFKIRKKDFNYDDIKQKTMEQ